MIARRGWRCCVGLLSAFVLIVLAADVSLAQEATPPTNPTGKRAAAQEIAPKTSDGVQLAGTFYPATKPSKEVVPIILLHGHKGSRADMKALAEKLQDAGHAALALDLRGHGGSTRQTMPNGKEREIDPARLTKNELEMMSQLDVEKAKSFLMERNNAGELNIDKLCVVGADMGAVVAANWAMRDWSYPTLPVAGKQGQDVKAIVMLSPPKNIKGLSLMTVLTKRDFASKLSWLIVYGEQESDAKDVKATANQLEKWLPKPSPDEAKEKQALYVLPLATNLQGTKLLAAENFNVAPQLIKFINLRLVKKPYPWADRKTLK